MSLSTVSTADGVHGDHGKARGLGRRWRRIEGEHKEALEKSEEGEREDRAPPYVSRAMALLHGGSAGPGP